MCTRCPATSKRACSSVERGKGAGVRVKDSVFHSYEESIFHSVWGMAYGQLLWVGHITSRQR